MDLIAVLIVIYLCVTMGKQIPRAGQFKMFFQKLKYRK